MGLTTEIQAAQLQTRSCYWGFSHAVDKDLALMVKFGGSSTLG